MVEAVCREEAVTMLEATRKALAKAQTAARSDVTAAAGTLAGEQQRRAAAEAEAGEARAEARLVSEELASERRASHAKLERLQECADAAEARLAAAQVWQPCLPGAVLVCL